MLERKKRSCSNPWDDMTTKKAVLFTFVVYLCIAVVGLSVALSLSGTQAPEDEYKNLVEAGYRKAYYDLTAAVDEIGVKLKKLGVSTNAEMQESLLYETWKTTELAAYGLSSLSALDGGVLSTQKFLNQTGDYAYYLSLKIGGGTALTSEQKQTLAKMSSMFETLSQELTKIGDKLSGGGLFVDNDFTTEVFSGLSSESVEYPQMIYDGPFSDSMLLKDVLGLSGADVSEAAARDIIADALATRTVSDVEFLGEFESDFVTLDFNMTVDGAPAFFQIAKKGGTVVQISVYAEPSSGSKTQSEYVELAENAAGEW